MLERRGVMIFEEANLKFWYPMVLNEIKGLTIVAELREPVARELKDGVTSTIVAGARGRLVAAWFDFST